MIFNLCFFFDSSETWTLNARMLHKFHCISSRKHSMLEEIILKKGEEYDIKSGEI